MFSRYSDGRERLGFDSRQGQEILLHDVQTGSGAQPASYPIGAKDKAAGA
jgi:hypothetical protein